MYNSAINADSTSRHDGVGTHNGGSARRCSEYPQMVLPPVSLCGASASCSMKYVANIIFRAQGFVLNIGICVFYGIRRNPSLSSTCCSAGGAPTASGSRPIASTIRSDAVAQFESSWDHFCRRIPCFECHNTGCYHNETCKVNML